MAQTDKITNNITGNDSVYGWYQAKKDLSQESSWYQWWFAAKKEKLP